jgi:formamidopyrimidine-DNA glycosylase
MPELPEVETTVKGLQAKVLLRTFVDVWSDWKKMVKKPNFELFKKELQGKKIIKVWRRAKNVIFDLSDGYSLLVHMKMTGHLMYGIWNMKNNTWQARKDGPLKEKINGYLHIIFFLDNGSQIALSDYRKFAKVELWKTEELLTSKEFNSWGPEPLEKSFTLAKFKEVLKHKKGRIKQVIMEPKVIAGVGNIYSSEALWWAKIHPEKSASKLTDKELKSLYDAIKKVLQQGINLGGESFADYRNVEGEKGHFGSQRMVYKREKESCKRCNTIIVRKKFGGRSAFFCPKCQKP